MLIIVPVSFGIFSPEWQKMLISAVVIIAVWFFLNMDKFKYFKFLGLEAKLQKAVNKAYAAIHQLKELGLSLSSPILHELAVSGNILYFIDLKYKLEHAEKIIAGLKELGASEKEIEENCHPLYHFVTNKHVRAILGFLKQGNVRKKYYSGN